MAVSMETIGMVLVQEDEELQEHVIYYLSQNLIDAEIHYSHVEKLALATIHAVQWLRHYILLPDLGCSPCQSISICPHSKDANIINGLSSCKNSISSLFW